MSETHTMSKFQQAQLNALAESTQAWLGDLNSAGREAFEQAPWPTRKTEAFKYCSLKTLADHPRAAAAPVATASTEAIRAAANIPHFDGYQLVLVNGQVNTELSDALALEQVTLLSQASTEQQALAKEYLGKSLGKTVAGDIDPSHLFNQLNNAVLQDGVLIEIKRNSRLDKPLYLCYLNTEADAGFTVNSRVLVVLETGAELELVEHYASLDGTNDNSGDNSFTNAMTEVVVGDNARLIHYRLQLMHNDAAHIGSVWVNLKRDANYQAFHLALGSQLTRNDIVVHHSVGGSHSDINGVYVPQGKQLVDFHTCIEHAAAHCTSNEIFRGIINDQAKAVFNGRIHIHKDAQKTLAELSNKNLLLTNKAEINTKPELEIYADDVKCAHGATVAQLDDKARFYLQSRGISEDEAQVMLSFGFINELLDAMPDEAIGHWLRPILAKRFGREQSFDEDLVESVL
jgi:Fe-S cluster assembly protein SufD